MPGRRPPALSVTDGLGFALGRPIPRLQPAAPIWRRALQPDPAQPVPSTNRLRRPCPACGAGLVHVRRRAEDRENSEPGRVRRYVCRAAGCGWTGLLGAATVQAPAAPVKPRRRLPKLLGAAALVGGLSLAAAAAVLVVRVGLTQPLAQTWRQMQINTHPGGVHRLPPGENFDGELLRVAAMAPQPGLASSDASPGRTPETALADAAPARPASRSLGPLASSSASPTAAEGLSLRQGCVWGTPGRNPYQGTVEQALLAGRLPAELIGPLAERIRARQPNDRVSIRSTGIRAEHGGREFSPRGLALSFGRSMCLNSRVNFAPGHAEPADLYLVNDAAGRQRAVVVPDVCGNVSVLSAGGERRTWPRWLAGPLDVLYTALAAAPDGADGVTELTYAAALGGPSGPEAGHAVPEPGTLACVLAALLAAWRLTPSTRRQRAQARTAACAGPLSPSGPSCRPCVSSSSSGRRPSSFSSCPASGQTG